ncbi:MAG TPA: disulfide bond formation protein B, partial [Burkholderiales bacterium]|nr:disulfide bond formation protein B [Burkholderiales bacterium]
MPKLPQRVFYALGFLLCAGLLAYAYYLQFDRHLEPCPLCIFQRLFYAGTGLVLLIAALHNPGKTGRL